MKLWKCTVCDHIHVGEEPPERCPKSGVGREMFVEIGKDKTEKEEKGPDSSEEPS